MNTKTVFDLDHTLMAPDNQQDEATHYCMPVWPHIYPAMWKIFEETDHKMILTNRHPCVERILRNHYHIDCEIKCRPFCLDLDSIKIANSNKSELELFLDQMVYWKTSVLQELAGEYDEVVFYDDMIDRYRDITFPDNVILKVPVHMEEQA